MLASSKFRQQPHIRSLGWLSGHAVPFVAAAGVVGIHSFISVAGGAWCAAASHQSHSEGDSHGGWMWFACFDGRWGRTARQVWRCGKSLIFDEGILFGPVRSGRGARHKEGLEGKPKFGAGMGKAHGTGAVARMGRDVGSEWR